MTMHLAKGLSLINTKKPKAKKLTEAKRQKFEVQWRQHNKEMRRKNLHTCQFNTLNDYIDYIHGRYKPKNPTECVVSIPWHQSGIYRRETPDFPSLKSKDSFGPCTKKEPMRYTGERKLLGIATLHKSNMVPIFDDGEGSGKKQAEDIAKMRRN